MKHLDKNKKWGTSVLRRITRHPYHWHEAITILKVLEGMISLRIRANVYALKPGDFIIINIGEVHHIESITASNLVFITYIDASYYAKLVEDFDAIRIYCNSLKLEELCPIRCKRVRNLIDELLIVMAKNGHMVHHQIEGLIKELVLVLTEEFDYVSMGIHLKKFSPKVVERNRQIYREMFLRDSPMKRLSLKDIAAQKGISYTHLRKDIIERYGCGYKALRYGVMMDHAVKLLLTTDKTITHISYITGFSDPKYMIKCFKDYYACTPSVFRRQYRSKHYSEICYHELPLKPHYIT